jgi:hypothetical protein
MQRRYAVLPRASKPVPLMTKLGRPLDRVAPSEYDNEICAGATLRGSINVGP